MIFRISINMAYNKKEIYYTDDIAFTLFNLNETLLI